MNDYPGNGYQYPKAPPPPYFQQYASDAREFAAPQSVLMPQSGLQYPNGFGLNASQLSTAPDRTITVISYEPPQRGCRCVHVLLAVLVCIAVFAFLSEFLREGSQAA